MMLAVEFLLVGVLGGAIGLLITRSPVGGVAIGAAVAITIDLIGWLVAVRATIALTHAVEVTPEQAKVLHDVVEGLCIRTGLPKPKVYIVDDPAPNAFAFGRSPSRAGVCVTSGLLNLMSRRELEGVLAHELSHIRNRDVQVTTLAVTTVGAARRGRRHLGPRARGSPTGATTTTAAALLLIAVAVACRRPGVRRPPAVVRDLPAPRGAGRHERGRARLARRAAPRAREARGRPHRARTTCRGRPRTSGSSRRCTSRARAHTPRLNRLFDTHPPLDERIAILRKLEGLDPTQRGPVDQTITGVPVDLAKLSASTELRTARGSGATAAPLASTATEWTLPPAGRAASRRSPTRRARHRPGAPTGHPPGWYHADAQTLRYWDGSGWTDWTAQWNGRRWVQNRPGVTRGSADHAAFAQALRASSRRRPSSVSSTLGGVLPHPRHARLGALGHLRQLHRVAGHEHRLARRRRCAASRRSCAAPRGAGRRSRRGRGCSARRRCRPR